MTIHHVTNIANMQASLFSRGPAYLVIQHNRLHAFQTLCSEYTGPDHQPSETSDFHN